MLRFGILFSLLILNTSAIENGTEVCTSLTTCDDVLATKSEVAAVREEQARQAAILEGLDKKLQAFVTNTYPANCAESRNSSKLLVRVPSYSTYPFEVTCDQESHGGGWTTVLRRNDGSQDFFLEWKDYQKGFGQLDNEFFIGLDKLHAMTSSEPHELLVLLENFYGNQSYELYDNFRVGPESNNYTLESVGSFSGDAGDSLEYHLGRQFTTKERGDCAKGFQGAWWYYNCLHSDLCGMYGEMQGVYGIIWSSFRTGEFMDMMKRAVMLIRPATFSTAA
ncbi:angiopoietin-related protein 6-like [Drosophila rhopaloa]|uniref:Fibrinogen C-terminal domain-containing protein n=1 Tax=Drosophila rhopaloa TaxID=1041015 RepID=A0ABM5J935_DRORH|nr:angiopoietin-related protein 6-like [Drosophila rhopaloa]